MTDTLTTWMAAYRNAWESNDPSDIGALFTEDALYYKEPFTEPLRGRDAIVAMWHEHQDAAGTTTFTWNLLVETDDLAIVQGETDYTTVRYSNLWVIRLAADDSGVGRATEFTEWWMDQSTPS
ncbi:MAG TPA: nuclear transport factor 2 family protein [Galbitalea sp.]|nr:nuclear transport factor 2 family protein [Galbitalea sp.]